MTRTGIYKKATYVSEKSPADEGEFWFGAVEWELEMPQQTRVQGEQLLQVTKQRLHRLQREQIGSAARLMHKSLRSWNLGTMLHANSSNIYFKGTVALFFEPSASIMSEITFYSTRQPILSALERDIDKN